MNIDNDEQRQHNDLDDLMTEALMREHPEWSMETIREAALICSNALLKTPNTAFLQSDSELSRLLDKYGRDLAVSGLHNHGFSTSAQKILKKLEASIQAMFAAQRQALRDEVMGALPKELDNALKRGEIIPFEGSVKHQKVDIKYLERSFANGYNQVIDQITEAISTIFEAEK